MKEVNHRLVATAAFSMAIAVILGALGAHALEASLDEARLDSFKTGVRYQVWHSLALLVLGLGGKQILDAKSLNRVSFLFLAGIICFSFSIYLLSTRDLLGISEARSVLGPITPIGGVLLIAAWILFGIKALKIKAIKTVDAD